MSTTTDKEKLRTLETHDKLLNQHRVEEALAESEARYQALFERAAIGVVLKRLDGQMFSFNPAFLNMLGFTAQEMSTYSYLDITHPKDKAASESLFRELVAGERDNYTLEKRYLCKDGRYRWGRMRASLLKSPTGEAQYVIGMIEDITEQKEIETELAEVQRRLVRSRELDRLHLAQELHDGPLQDIIGVTYQLKALENEGNAEYNLNKLHSIENTLDELAARLRDIASQLRPPVLAPFGLEKAIRSDVEQLQRKHPEFQIVARLAPDRQLLSNEIRFTLFRIYQEAVKNVLRHSGAKTIWVRFLLDEDDAVLEVQDDGRGFVPPKSWAQLARDGHLGLVGAIERAEAAGGRLEIESSPGKGTLIRTVVPRNEAKP